MRSALANGGTQQLRIVPGAKDQKQAANDHKITDQHDRQLNQLDQLGQEPGHFGCLEMPDLFRQLDQLTN